MQILTLYIATAAIFLIADAIMLKSIMQPLFQSHLGDTMRENPKLVVASVFYLVYVAGLLWLVSVPALRAGAPGQALLGGAILGAVAYGTYEFTSYAILKAWSPAMVATDFTWGIVVTGLSAWGGVLITRALT